jgi:hypothetical protein
VSETFGELVDKLITTDMKLWETQEQVYRFQKMTPEEYAAVPVAETKRAWDRLAQLNLDRNRLMTEIDTALNAAVRTGSARVDARIKLT